MKNIIKILIAAGVVVLAGIIVVVLFITGILGGSGGKPDKTVSDPEPTRSTSPRPSTSPSPSPTATTPPSPIAPSPTTPTPAPSPEPHSPGISGSGGETTVRDKAELDFTPDRSGVWVIRTSDNGDVDPYLTLLDARGDEITYDDDSAGNLNAMIVIYLDAGKQYTIVAETYERDGTSYTVSAKPAEVIAGGGDSMRVQGSAGYSFTPNESGLWEFRTSNNTGDPYLEIYDAEGWYVASDDDSAGDFNAVITQQLEAGDVYCIIAKEFWEQTDTFTLTVAKSTGGRGDGEAATISGGDVESVRVDAPDELEFTPDVEGIWIIYTTDNGGSDPYLSIYDTDGSLLYEDDDGWGDEYDAMLVVILAEGDTYTIEADLWDDSRATYTLVAVSPTDILTVGDLRVYSTSGYRFIPDRSGTYVLRTTDCYPYDPFIHVYNYLGEYIDGDDDSGGELNAQLTIYLNAGEVYHILVAFYEGIGSCVFSITGG